MSCEKSNKQSNVVPHSFIHCIEGSKGLDLETLPIPVKDHWHFDGWMQLLACLASVKMSISGVWRSQWEALVSSPVKGVPRAGWALSNDLETLFGSLIYGSMILITESQGWEGLSMLPLFLGVPITLLLWSQWALLFLKQVRAPVFQGYTQQPLSPNTCPPLVKKRPVLVPLLKQCWEDSEPVWSKKAHTCQKGGLESWF